ncbi:MAG TPA: FMN-binding protein, partial [Firmicutes bacterium]|nr:FMN-binding protein [Bacillota bacterium]
DGTYEGTGEGLFGAIKVSVTVQGGKITAVKVLEHSETEGIADAAISRVPDAIIEKQTVDVDAVSGATYTSKGIIDAVKDALMAFAMDTGNIDVSKLADGTYEGTGEGLFGAIKVSVTVQGGKITEVKVLEHGETDGIADAAISGVSNAIVETQDPNVDAVSGATFTSKGIIEAVKNALTGAKQE